MKTGGASKKTDFLGFKEDPEIAAAFREAAKAKGGSSAVLQRFVRKFVNAVNGRTSRPNPKEKGKRHVTTVGSER